jgi:LysR family transcriptional regulator (chromosome initiation inhibitor)
VTAAALAEAPALTFNQKDRLQSDWAQRLAGRPVALPTHLVPSSQAFVDAARLGLGWGMNPEPLVAGDIAAGRLVTLSAGTLDTELHWQVARLAGRPLAALTAAVRGGAGTALS